MKYEVVKLEDCTPAEKKAILEIQFKRYQRKLKCYRPLSEKRREKDAKEKYAC